MNATSVTINLIPTLASFVAVAAMWIQFRHSAGVDHEQSLRDENERLTRDLETCRRQREDMQQENLRLMRLLLQNGHKKEE